VFAPEERDVYIYERTPKDLAPLGAKSASETSVAQKRFRFYGTSGQRKDREAINIAPGWSEAVSTVRLHFKLEFANLNEIWKSCLSLFA
jgi:hypothetical protein